MVGHAGESTLCQSESTQSLVSRFNLSLSRLKHELTVKMGFLFGSRVEFDPKGLNLGIEVLRG